MSNTYSGSPPRNNSNKWHYSASIPTRTRWRLGATEVLVKHKVTKQRLLTLPPTQRCFTMCYKVFVFSAHFCKAIKVKPFCFRYIAMLWTSYLSLWHNHSIVGIHNIPTKGPGLIVWYHGPIPVDYIGLVARIYLETNRRVYSVVDRCLNMMPCLDMFRTHMRYN